LTTSTTLKKARAFFEAEENIFVFKTQLATRGVVNFYSAGAVTHARWIASRFQSYDRELQRRE
jgi:hypothetical protein